MFVLLYIDRRWRPRGGSLMGLYIALYGVGRFWVEGLRVDPADDVGPFRWNQWVALGAIAGGLALFFVLRGRPEPDPEPDVDVESSEIDRVDDLSAVDGGEAADAEDHDDSDDAENDESAGIADDEFDGEHQR